MYNIGLVSLGCAKNQTDAEIMLGILANDGFNITYNPSDADVIIVNTCGFIESAKQESIDAILEMAQYKNGRCRLLIATGCLAERYSSDILIELPEVDAIVGTGDYDKIAEVIREAFKGEKPVICGHNDRTPDERLPRILSTPSYTAYLKIADGCDNNCTYCAIPMIRGHFRSRKIEDIVEEAENLAKNGAKELILIAQDTSRYGKDLYGEYSLDKLLEKLVTVDGIKWIRVHYFYPEAITDSLIDTMAKYDKICNYIDMPVQHGNNEILRRMARRTTQEQMVERINKIREKMPDCTIRTSIIVGFPGETDEEFEDTLDVVEKVKFEQVYMFIYSRRVGTPGNRMENQVPEEQKHIRFDKLKALVESQIAENNQKYVGTIQKVLVEGTSKNNDDMLTGRTDSNKVVIFEGDKSLIGKMAEIKIVSEHMWYLKGKIANLSI